MHLELGYGERLALLFAGALWAGVHGLTTLLITSDFPFIEHNRLIDRHLNILIEGIRKK